MVQRLKDFIAQIRACKTAADERAVVSKESASIRTMLKEENTFFRHANVAKLLYIHMLGYPAQFGQIECVKLVASPRYSDKRLGYLGIMLLLDENQETLMLVTNSLKGDMQNPNPHVVALALSTMGNICSTEMARDLSFEVDRLLGSPNPFIRKKAFLCALRLVRKVPELYEQFLPRCQGALLDRNHGVLLANLALMRQLCAEPAALAVVRSLTRDLVHLLKTLVTTGYSQEHDVSGIADPFMQIALLRLLCIVGTGDAAASEMMNDVLALVATNTDASRNVGNAILYETVLTILSVKSESTLCVLAVNILGKFLSNKDNNIRYVALSTLLRSNFGVDPAILQRHRATVLECLRDSDVSIRRRALDLVFVLINPANVRVMTRELLSFLEVADLELRPVLASRLCASADAYAPNQRWHVDTVLRVLKLAGQYVRDDTVAQFVRLVANTESLHQYTTQRLYNLLTTSVAQDGLIKTGVWLIGEFGDVLVGSAAGVLAAAAPTGASEEDGEGDCLPGGDGLPVTEEKVLNLISSIAESRRTSLSARCYAVNALVKLATRFKTQSAQTFASAVMLRLARSADVEIQQRAVQYLNLLQLDGLVRNALWERIPANPILDTQKYARNAAAAVAATNAASATEANKQQAAGPPASLLSPTSLAIKMGYPAAAAAAAPPQRSILELMGLEQQMQNMGLSSNKDASTTLKSPTGGGDWNRSHRAFSGDHVLLDLTPARDGNRIAITAVFTSLGPRVEALQLQVAVPRTMTIEISAMSSATLAGPRATASQMMYVGNPEQRPLRLRLKLGYVMPAFGPGATEHMVDFKFPATIV